MNFGKLNKSQSYWLDGWGEPSIKPQFWQKIFINFDSETLDEFDEILEFLALKNVSRLERLKL